MKKILVSILKKYKIQIIVMLIFMIINIVLLTLPTKIIGNVIDLLRNISFNRPKIINQIVYLLIVIILLISVRIVWRVLTPYISRGVEKDLKDHLFNHFLMLKIPEIQKIKNGELMSYFVKDIAEIRSCVYKLLAHFSRLVLVFLIAGISMAKGISIKLTIAVLLPIIVTMYLIVIIKKQIEINFKKSQENFTKFSEYIQESMDAIQTSKAYLQEPFQIKNFIRRNKDLRNSNNLVDLFSNLLYSLLSFCFGICYSITLIYGSQLILRGEITIGELVTFNGYISLFIEPVSLLPGVISKMKRAKVSYRRLDEYFNLEKEKVDIKNKEIEKKLEGNIEIRNLTYNYPNNINKVLNNINIKIKKGETIGIIGTIGAGKTTLLNLLVKIFHVKRGKIFIDGKDINDIPITALRENICYITQESYIFSSSLKDNISLFKDEYDEVDIEKSIKNAMIDNEIKNMPNQINTILGGKDGINLSGGQKQRISISRAFFKNSDIIFFDDTFSALDYKTETEILRNIKRITKNKTCIIVSNRISDVKFADKIIVMDDGKIIEEGKHEELITKKGMYYNFFMQQSKLKIRRCCK